MSSQEEKFRLQTRESQADVGVFGGKWLGSFKPLYKRRCESAAPLRVQGSLRPNESSVNEYGLIVTLHLKYSQEVVDCNVHTISCSHSFIAQTLRSSFFLFNHNQLSRAVRRILHSDQQQTYHALYHQPG